LLKRANTEFKAYLRFGVDRKTHGTKGNFLQKFLDKHKRTKYNRGIKVMKNIKQALLIMVILILLTVTGCLFVKYIEERINMHNETEVEEPVKTKTEDLVIEVPKQNSTGTVTIVTYDKQTGEEITTEVHGTIKVLSNGYDGEQKYLVYTITE
jgi:hypothetical protein